MRERQRDRQSDRERKGETDRQTKRPRERDTEPEKAAAVPSYHGSGRPSLLLYFIGHTDQLCCNMGEATKASEHQERGSLGAILEAAHHVPTTTVAAEVSHTYFLPS